MKSIVANALKFHKIQIDGNKVLNHLIHIENKIVELLKKTRNFRYRLQLIISYRIKIRYIIWSLKNPKKYC